MHKPLHSKKVTVWAAMRKGQPLIGPFFFEDENENTVSVTSERYIDTALKPFWAALVRLGVDRDEEWFQQDGATPHTARASLDWLERHFPGATHQFENGCALGSPLARSVAPRFHALGAPQEQSLQGQTSDTSSSKGRHRSRDAARHRRPDQPHGGSPAARPAAAHPEPLRGPFGAPSVGSLRYETRWYEMATTDGDCFAIKLAFE